MMLVNPTVVSMSFSPASIVSLVVLATLCGGALEGMATARTETGVARSLPWDVDVAVVETPIDAETDDVDGCPHDREWPAGVQAGAAELRAGSGHIAVMRQPAVAPVHGRATSSIRGPPERG
jgi:hypothetical protein